MSQAGELAVLENHPEILTEVITDSGTAVPIAHVMEFLGEVVPNANIPFRSIGSGNTVTYQIQYAGETAISDAAEVGVASFDSAAFNVDANGFVTLAGGGGAMTNIDVDASTPPGTDPVVPNGSGNIIFTGAQVATGTVGANVIRSFSGAANTVTYQIQRSTTAAATDSTKNGVAHFDSASFAVDANGFVTLAGGGLAIDSIAVQTGTSPIVPTAGGLVTINGAVVAAGTNPIRSNGTGANTMAMEIQISQALAATDATKIGLCNFNSAQFTVDANGFVSTSGSAVPNTITGDSGGALFPTAGNWNILGGPGVTTSGSGSTLTINSVVYTDQGGSTSVTSDSGSFATSAITLTLPASPAQGELCSFIATTAAVLVVDAPGTQLIRIGNAVSSAGGTATSSGLAGDSLVLRYRTADTTWYSEGGPQGVWITA